MPLNVCWNLVSLYLVYLFHISFLDTHQVMKSAYRSVMFYIGQKELELQFKMKRIVAQCRQKCEAMQEKFTQKMEQVHTTYQKMAKRCQMMEQEIENLSKDKQELQEKFSEKSRFATSHHIRSCCQILQLGLFKLHQVFYFPLIGK